MDDTITPPFHEHPLRLSESIVHETGRSRCSICGKKLSGQIYACSRGGCSCFQIHKSCVNLPPDLQHFLHPSCTLTLRVEDGHCEACFDSIFKIAYICGKCNFTLDAHCSKLPDLKDEQILHFSHPHPLTLFNSEGDCCETCCCQVCGEPCSSASKLYGCSRCKFFIHVSCLAMLPQKIHHPSHPSCPLLLYPALYQVYRDGMFNTKRKAFSFTLMFYCRRCRVSLCMPCWLSPVIELHSGVEQLTPDCSIKWRGRSDNMICEVCKRECLPPFSTGDLCMRSRQIQHFSHPSHGLSLVHTAKMGITSTSCNLCRDYCNDFTFLCYLGECPLFFHAQCAFVKPTVQSSDHPHPLTVVDNIYDDEVKCQACSNSCFNFPVIRCQGLKCKYALHIWCGPLPTNIKHPCHVHSLVLKDYYVTDVDVDDSNFCCHVCEEHRNPRLCVYLCEEGCPMISEVNCVASEVAALLRGERGEVELRTVGKARCTSEIISRDQHRSAFPEKVISIDQIVEMLNKMGPDGTPTYMHLETKENQSVHYRMSFRKFFEVIAADVSGEANYFLSYALRKARSVTEVIECKDETPLFSEEAFKNLMNKVESFDINDELIPEFLNFASNSEFITVDGGFEVPSILLHAARYLSDACKDLFLESDANIELKALSFLFVCIVMEDMGRTKVMDVNEDKLCEWWGYINWVKQAGLQVQFMLDHLRMVTRAYFGLQVRKKIDENKREIEGITKEMQKLSENLERVEKLQHYIEAFIRKPSSVMKQCLNDAGKIRWRYAAEGMISIEAGSSSNVGWHEQDGERDETHGK